MKKSILVIDDEETLRKALERFLKEQGYEVTSAADGQAGLIQLKEKPFDLLLVDLMLPQISGIEVIRKGREIQPGLVAIVMTGFGTIPSAVEAIRAGAYHYVTKPFDLEDIASLLKKALEHSQLKEENLRLKKELREKYGFENIIGQSSRMQEIYSLVRKVAESESTVLIMGESGTGKELLARAVHFRSPRAEKPFVAVNCAAIPEGLLESELFGHMKGAFTGAVQTRPGKFELADHGTIFLDEIGDMSPKLQVKVLRVLQDRRFEPVGSNKTREVDIRIIAATNQDLARAVADGRFREDLFYRLNVIPITLPPLRERRDDIPLLIGHFLKKYNRENQREVTGFSPEALELLLNYRWPGNVRELENFVERLVILKGKGQIEAEDLPPNFQRLEKPRFLEEIPFPEDGISFKDLVQRFEMELIRRALQQSGGNKNKAARLLQLNRTTLVEKMKRMPGEEDDGELKAPVC
jgi:DNA-binding NtrC family response regulator